VAGLRIQHPAGRKPRLVKRRRPRSLLTRDRRNIPLRHNIRLLLSGRRNNGGRLPRGLRRRNTRRRRQNLRRELRVDPRRILRLSRKRIHSSTLSKRSSRNIRTSTRTGERCKSFGSGSARRLDADRIRLRTQRAGGFSPEI